MIYLKKRSIRSWKKILKAEYQAYKFVLTVGLKSDYFSGISPIF